MLQDPRFFVRTSTIPSGNTKRADQIARVAVNPETAANLGVVVTVTEYGDAAPTATTRGEGFAAQVAPVGVPLHERATLPEKPPTLVALRLYVAVWPALIVAEAAEPKEKSPAFPLSGTMRAVVFGTLVVRLRVPSVAPDAVGVNVTVVWHFPPTAIVVHPFTTEKPAVGTTLLTWIGMVPTLLRVTVCAGLVPPTS